MSDHMVQLNKTLTDLREGRVRQYIFITSPQMINEQIDRAYAALASMGFAALASRTLGSITLGANEKVNGKGFKISYLGLTDNGDILPRLRGQSAHVVVLEEADIGRVLTFEQRQILGAEIDIINSKYEIQVG